MRPSKCARITSLKVHFYKQNRRLLSSRYALFDGRLSNLSVLLGKSGEGPSGEGSYAIGIFITRIKELA
jgi:hypothetical protein